MVGWVLVLMVLALLILLYTHRDVLYGSASLAYVLTADPHDVSTSTSCRRRGMIQHGYYPLSTGSLLVQFLVLRQLLVTLGLLTVEGKVDGGHDVAVLRLLFL